MTQINSNNEEESNTEKTGQIEKLADDNNQNVNKSAYVESVEKILFMYSTAVSDVGTVRSNNQDSAFAGEHLAAICEVWVVMLEEIQRLLLPFVRLRILSKIPGRTM